VRVWQWTSKPVERSEALLSSPSYCTFIVAVPLAVELDPPEYTVMLAVIVAVPIVTPLASPLLFTVATLVLLLDHDTRFVKSMVWPLFRFPTALNCCVLPAETLGLEGVTVIGEVVCSGLAMMVILVVAEPLSCDTVIVAVPAPTVVTVPALTVATLLFDDVHFADEVTSLVSPFTVVPVAVRVIVCPLAAMTDVGDTDMVAIASPEVKKLLHEENSSVNRRMPTEIAMNLAVRKRASATSSRS
jgi:hypothetical protein